jgi:hypothetical protein
MLKIVGRLFVLFAASSLSLVTHAASPDNPAAKVDRDKTEQARKDALRTRFDISAKFIVSMIHDGAGGVWIGTEDHGLYHYDPNANDGKPWRQFAVKDGLGDNNAYALALDRLGRIWVGHLNHGVSVFNGRQWKT